MLDVYVFPCFRWEGKGENEIGYDDKTNVVRVRISSKYYRPAEVVSNETTSFLFFVVVGKAEKNCDLGKLHKLAFYFNFSI